MDNILFGFAFLLIGLFMIRVIGDLRNKVDLLENELEGASERIDDLARANERIERLEKRIEFLENPW